MKLKLTREDFEGYKSHVIVRVKQAQMNIAEGVQVLEWIEKELKKFPSKDA